MERMGYVEHKNTDNGKIEFLFCKFDYIDGGDKIANIWKKKYSINVGEKKGGIWFFILPIADQDYNYKIVWHEDVGNYVYCEEQTEEANNRLEEMVQYAVNEINRQIDLYNKNNPDKS